MQRPLQNCHCLTFPLCTVLCPPLMFPRSTNFRCTNKEGSTIDCLDAVDGTSIYYDCPIGYKFPEGTTGLRACVEGSWGTPQPACLQEDTVTKPSPVPHIVTNATLPPFDHIPEEEEPILRMICVYAAFNFYDSNVDPDDLDSSLCSHVIYSSVGLAADGSLNIQGSPVPAGGTKSELVKLICHPIK